MTSPDVPPPPPPPLQPLPRPALPRGPELRGGGCLIAAGIFVGTIVGIVLREGSLGLVAGFGVGIAGAVILYLADRRR